MPYLTSSQTEWLKWLALITMVLDHIGAAFSANYPALGLFRVIGRFSYLTFGFIIALNLSRDHIDFSKYFCWMLITALLSESVFKAFNPEYGRLNTLFQFFSVIGVVWVYQVRHIFHYGLQGIFYAIFFFISYHADYSLFGLLYCLACYLFFQVKTRQDRLVAMSCCILLGSLMNYQFLNSRLGYLVVLSLIVTFYYLFSPSGIRRSTPGVERMKKVVFYAFYPIHLLMIVTIKFIFIG
ncbi:TraX family protein [Rodentibacter myodis]|uniref:TraX protein n=1 Tax=Rodentibacter myodis TaxID=1907939 RepID=A0A1V3JSG4_9PAST|nr:TraX family protein [Rodentibacter myodis]OOF59740.1 hypothetical protein BKL49_02835 [Rodentibacter myodis]